MQYNTGFFKIEVEKMLGVKRILIEEEPTQGEAKCQAGDEHTSHKKKFKSEANDDKVLKKFKESGIYLRMICPDYDVYDDDENEGEPQSRSLEDELNVLIRNKQILTSKGIHTAEALRQNMQNNRFDGFLSRPATWVKQDLPIDIYHEGLGLIIDPDCPSTLVTYIYKKTALTYNLSREEPFLFTRPEPNRVKDLSSTSALTSKLLENEARRTGQAWDNYNRHFGLEKEEYNESLLSYFDGIMGLVVSDWSRLTEALQFRELLQSTTKSSELVSLYEYDLGVMTLISDEKIEKQLLQQEKDGPYLFSEEELGSDDFPPYLQLLPESKPMNPMNSHLENMGYHPELFQNIRCSLADFPPSKEHPVTYQFDCTEQSDNPEVKPQTFRGETFFENGRPKVKISTGSISHTFFRCDMQKIVREHQKILIEKCTKLLRNEKVLEQLETKNMSLKNEIKVRGGESDDRFSPYLLLSYSPNSLENHDPESLLQAIGYDTKQCKWGLVPTGSELITIRLSVLQALDSMVKTLGSLAEFPVEEMGDSKCPVLIKRGMLK